MSDPSTSTNPPTIHEATLASGCSGLVEYGAVLTIDAAVKRRQQGLDVVVRGAEARANRAKAREIETAVGQPIIEDAPHAKAGPHALPHFHQRSRSPKGHT